MGIRARKIKEKAHPKEPMVQRQKQETKQQMPKEPARARQRHETKQQIPDPKRQQEFKKEQDTKVKKETVSFFGRFLPGGGSKSDAVEEKKPMVVPKAKESIKVVQKATASSLPAKAKLQPKDITAGMKKGPDTQRIVSQMQTVVPLQGTIKRKPKKPTVEEDLPDLEAADVAKAAVQIQAAYKGFKTRQMVKQHKEILPDLNCAQVQDATVKIQSAYRGFKTRKQMRESGEELPDLKAADVVAATIKIQSAYKGFKTRKAIRDQQARQE